MGGTLGNIMMIMAHYGWHAIPVTRLDVSVDSEKIVDDMKANGMDLRYVIREGRRQDSRHLSAQLH